MKTNIFQPKIFHKKKKKNSFDFHIFKYGENIMIFFKYFNFILFI